MMNNFLLPGLQDLCVSRSSFKWGIPVDFAPGHVVYVWLDALTNYITGVGYDPDTDSGDDMYKKYWPADLHLVGKDIIRFHTIYWPIFLMSLDQPLPKQVFGHPWLLLADGKMSKSKGNVLYADDLVKEFGVDAVRYFVLHEMPFENDGSISWELMTERYNSDLANILGNLVSRTISMTNKYFGGIVENNDVEEPVDDELADYILDCARKVDEKMDALRVADAITERPSTSSRRCNKYIDETMPWVLAKDEAKQERLKTVLYNLTEGITIGASLLASFMPETSRKGYSQSSILTSATGRTWIPLVFIPTATGWLRSPRCFLPGRTWSRCSSLLSHSYPRPSSLRKLRLRRQEEKEEKAIEHKPVIDFDDFAKMELRVGEIIACEEVPNSKKLLKETVKLGSRPAPYFPASRSGTSLSPWWARRSWSSATWLPGR